MELLPEFQGEMPWPCGEGFHLARSCTQNSMIDFLGLAFAVIYFLSLARSCRYGNRTEDRIFLFVSIPCIAIAVMHFAMYLWPVRHEHQGLLQWSSSAILARGLVWIAIAVSLNFHPGKWMRILVATWWILYSSCILALDLENLIKYSTLGVVEVASSPANLMLIFCSCKLIRHGTSTANSILQPLIVDQEQEETGLSNASFLSKVTFSWLDPLLRIGRSKPLDIDDVPELDPADGASFAYQRFAEAWDFQKRDRVNIKNVAFLALARCYGKEMLLVAFYALLRTLSVSATPILLYKFVQYSTCTESSRSDGLLLVACLILAKVVESLSQRHWFFDARRCGMRMRSALMAAVFRKQLKLSSLGRKNHSTGEIVNYIAVDAYRLGEFPWWFHTTWSFILQLFLAATILLGTAGVGAALGLILLAIFGALNIPFAKFLQKCQYQFMISQEERLHVTSETLSNMKIIKLQSWEEHFRRMIQSLRDVEFKWLKEIQLKKAYGSGIYWASPIVISAVIFTGCAVTRSAPLSAGTIFTVISTLRLMSEPMKVLPEALSMMIQAKVSLDRIDNFLLEDEIEGANQREQRDSDVCIRICKGDFSWDNDASNLTIKDINLEIAQRQKIAICGTVGAGKSSILHAILGEIPRITGLVEVIGSIAYVSQASWIQSGTIRDNILFGKMMDKKRYEMAIKSCALDKDIENFKHGDLTEIGQRGVNMSGGQKQRIQLARAVYNDADIYLLDDPFSAVAAHTAATLFNDCVMAALADKTVILVTHQIEFLSEMDQILVMNRRQITQSGRYKELLETGTKFEQLMEAHKAAMTSIDQANQGSREEAPKNARNQLTSTHDDHDCHDAATEEISNIQLTKDEERESGYEVWKPYVDYIKVSKGYVYLFLVVLSYVLFAVFQMIAMYWLAIAIRIPRIGAGTLIGTYTVISALSCFFVLLRSWFAACLGLKSSRAFFSGFTDSVFNASMLFFDSTPLGRILTRASSDMSILDFSIPFSIAFALSSGIEMLTIIAAMATVTWQVLLVAMPIMVATGYVQRYYLSSARELVRINGITKAPVINHAAETSHGAITIRVFSKMKHFILNNLKHIDTDAKLYFHTVATMEWILIRVEALQIITIFTATMLLVLLHQDTKDPGLVGLSLSYALTLTTTQVFFTRWYTNLDNHIISVERIKQYMHIPPEAQAIVYDKRPPPSWPYEGRIDLQDLKVKYHPNAALVLKGITCTFAAGEKIGIVGRTGSGKTTLISALFRLVEPADGVIFIDNIDICSIGLKDLRMKISIIPQEPTLFRGSVRSNLDPLGQFSDDEIWEALEKCQLRTTIAKLPHLLDSSVSSEGENWSVGQRQLFCLGRILLRRNRVLVLDEATASIDTATDAALNIIIREEFSTCTIITVAHRLPTVMDSDKVMVLSYGNLVEYDEPSYLVGRASSFSNLVAEYWSTVRGNHLKD